MGFYNGDDLDNLIELINKDNADTLPWPLDRENFIYGKPRIIPGATADVSNTEIRIQAKSSSNYRGSVDLKYRRIDLGVLFRGIPIVINRWWVSYIDANTLVPLINERYGLNLKQDFGTGSRWHTSHTGQIRAFTQHADNYFYTGSADMMVILDKEELGLDTLTVNSIKTVAWPGGNNFAIDRRGQLEFLFAGIDITDEAIPYGTTTSLTAQTIITRLNKVTLPVGYNLVALNGSSVGTSLRWNRTDIEMKSNMDTLVRVNGYPIVKDDFNTIQTTNWFQTSVRLEMVESPPTVPGSPKKIPITGFIALHHNS